MSSPEDSQRRPALDVARGLIMVWMVLDHARDFYHGFGHDPTDLDATTPALFFTRWITHFCAPGFVLLAGASAYLYGKKRSAADRRRFLLTRGAWLVVLEVTVVRLGWVPDPLYRFTLLQVIWAIGWSMILLAPLSSLPPRFLVAIGGAIVLLHNLLDPIRASDFGQASFFWSIIHERGMYEPIAGHFVRVSYPIVPWVGVMAIGFGLGELYTRRAADRARATLRVGLALCAAFVVVRGVNVYGDPQPWSFRADALSSVMSFLNCEKYPPSLAYLLMTLGPIFLLLWSLERVRWPSSIAMPLSHFGRVPLFFYVAHLHLLRFSSIAFAYARWGPSAFLFPPEGHAGSPEWPLFATYIVWMATLVLLFLPCRAYARLKERRAHTWWWLSYV